MSPEDEEARNNAIIAASAHFDVSDIELQDTAVLTVQNLKRDDDLLVNGKPVRITIYGPGSKQGVRATYRAQSQMQLRLMSASRGKFDKKGQEQSEAERREKLLAITAGIENLPFDAADLYKNQKLIDIHDQVDLFFNEKANFSKASLPS
jgi:hypothetical protein